MTNSSPQLETLTRAAAVLLFPSETDAHFTPFFWPDDRSASTLTPDRIAQLVGVAPGQPIKTVKLESFSGAIPLLATASRAALRPLSFFCSNTTFTSAGSTEKNS